jgi:hypothetical protein
VGTSSDVYVFHLKRFVPGIVPNGDKSAVRKALAPLLPLVRSNKVFKCGVGVTGDVDLLRAYFPDLPTSCVPTYTI